MPPNTLTPTPKVPQEYISIYRPLPGHHGGMHSYQKPLAAMPPPTAHMSPDQHQHQHQHQHYHQAPPTSQPRMPSHLQPLVTQLQHHVRPQLHPQQQIQQQHQQQQQQQQSPQSLQTQTSTNANANANANGNVHVNSNSPSASLGASPLSLPPVGHYPTNDALFEAIQLHAKRSGYCFIKLRSTKKGTRTTVTYGCDRYGKPPAPKDGEVRQRQRKHSSRRTDCQFSILGVQLKDGAGWEIRYRGQQYCVHNHPPSESATDHKGHRKLSQEDVNRVKALHIAGVNPKQVITFLRLTADTQLLPHDVYNLYASFQREQAAGERAITALLHDQNDLTGAGSASGSGSGSAP